MGVPMTQEIYDLFFLLSSLYLEKYTYDRPANPYHAENNSLILGIDATSIPLLGFSCVCMSPFSAQL